MWPVEKRWPQFVKKTVSDTGSKKVGFIQAMLAPVNARKHHWFGTLDAVLVGCLVVGILVAMRYLLAN